MKIQEITTLAVSMTAVVAITGSATAATAMVNGKTFDLDQFDGAAVTYRTDGGVSFAGKTWDNEVGVDLYTLGELAAGQYGSDPGDQVSLNDRNTPDWLKLTYGTGLTIGANTEFVVFEISSSSSGVDTEGLSWKIGFNDATPTAVSSADVSYFPAPGGTQATNMAVFDLADFGFIVGDTLNSVYIENIDSGNETSDPDFIFAGLTVPEPTSLALLAIGGLGMLCRRRHG